MGKDQMMREPANIPEVRQRLQAVLGAGVSVSATDALADLLWDRDTNADEFRQSGGSVTVQMAQSQRLVVLMLVRNELRFWLSTHKDPHTEGSKSGIGALPSFEAAVTLCDEFIRHDVAIEKLTTPPRSVCHVVYE